MAKKTIAPVVDAKKFIIIKGARVHNLKNVSLVLPRNKLIVFTGVSGSGKSSLAFDTLYAEGQRRYVESLSAYARQFLGRINKPEVDSIVGISPAIAIEQKVISRNPRSTVGTSTEIYDYLKLLYARIGKTYSPISNCIVKRDTVADVIGFLFSLDEGTRFLTLAPIIVSESRKLNEQLTLLLRQGFVRMFINNEIVKTEDLIDQTFDSTEPIYIVIDRLSIKKGDEDLVNRISDSVQTAFYEGNGCCCIQVLQPPSASIKKTNDKIKVFSNRFEADGITFEEPSEHFFSFNNPFGACKVCQGFGSVIGIDENLVVPDKSKSIYDDAIACWRGEKMREWKNKFIKYAHKINFPVHTAYNALSAKQKEELWNGTNYAEGINAFFKFLEEQSFKIQYRVMLSRYRGKTTCPSCQGTRLRKDASYVKVGGKSINEIVLSAISEVHLFFKEIKLSEYDQQVANRILIEITNRLQFLNDVGLGYLTLNRLSNSLSGGESQRINLATSLGSSLIGSLYILDEPSIGLHSKDTERLIAVLKSLRDIGNTVVVVEHDEDIMRAADEIVDIGPFAGVLGGEVVFQGAISAIKPTTKGLTAQYINGVEVIETPISRRMSNYFIELKGVRENNLKNFSVRFYLNTLTVVSGVSGSGKSSLVKKILYPAVKKHLVGYAEHTGLFDSIGGDLNRLTGIEFIDQNPIGKSSRSNPVTYIKAYDDIRALFADLPLSKSRGYKPSHFSFNVDGGRCEVCEGDGTVTIGMQFMADIELVCEACSGKRFKQELLEVELRGKNIAALLELTVDEAIDFFGSSASTIEHKIATKLQPLADVGLGYIRLGQSSSTLSGGEAQRIKLASFLHLGQQKNEHQLFIFDEPTTGLHFHDIKKLLAAFNALLNKGHSIVVVEHNIEVIKCADWVIDMGPEGGNNGGQLLFEGTPEDLVQCAHSATGKYVKYKLSRV